MKKSLICFVVVIGLVAVKSEGEASCGDTECERKGKCYKDNETWLDGCFTLRCSADKYHWGIDVELVQCKDKDGTCVEDGEPMPGYGTGCICTTKGNSWSMKCNTAAAGDNPP